MDKGKQTMLIDKNKYENIKCVTQYPVAKTSPDHICPVGTINDNHTSEGYIEEIEKYCSEHMNKTSINYMDIGCAGGQLAVDFAVRGHFSIGLEGSDHSIKKQLHNWPKYYKTVLHTADLTKPYQIEDNGKKILFDVISAWEVIEHIHSDDLSNFFQFAFSNLQDDGIFVASISTGIDERILPTGETIQLHQSVFSEEYWKTNILHPYQVLSYPFKNVVRTMAQYFLIIMKKK